MSPVALYAALKPFAKTGLALLFLSGGAVPASAADGAVCGVHVATEERLKRGREAFANCRACHDIGSGAENRSGPSLNGLMGRRAGRAPGYASSMPMVFAGERGLIWDEETLADFLRDPIKLVPGVEMPFIGVDGDDRIQDLVAFLSAAASGCLDLKARPDPVRHAQSR